MDTVQTKQHWLPENPTSDDAIHEGPRGYAHALKDGSTFVVLGGRGDLNPGRLGEHGLYHAGTRHLSRLTLRIAGHRPIPLHAATRPDNTAHVTRLVTPTLVAGGRRLERGAITIERSSCVRGPCYYERLELISYASHPVVLRLGYTVEADFADLFEIRGIDRARRGEARPPRHEADGLCLSYLGLDGALRVTDVRFAPRPERLGDGGAELAVSLAPRQPTAVELRVSCHQGEPPAAFSSYVEATGDLAAERTSEAAGTVRIATSSELYDRWFHRSAADLWMMNTHLPAGRYPFAGLPWFTTVFGRDGILTALQALWWDPSLARGVLRCLADLQAHDHDPARDAEPGKIVHELREGEMADLAEVPFGRYYGSVDATPLFVILAGAHFRATGDRELLSELWPNVERALDWIDEYGDRDGDGLIEYRPSPEGLVHQGWKDSPDAVAHADGRPAPGTIALCEVQGYAFAARRAGAAMAEALGRSERAADLRRRAEALRRRFEDQMWIERLGCYAMALDGDKSPCEVVSSNAGHSLLCGIASPERDRRVAGAMASPAMFSGWGIRTLSAEAGAYNPASYHNGSVWPHDTALVAAGLARYGMTDWAAVLLRCTKEASARLELARLPELFCGFDREAEMGPTPYPSACAPQAWSAAAAFMLLAASLGLEIEARPPRVTFRHPALPPDLDEVEIRGLRVGEASIDLNVYRSGERVAVAPARADGAAEVVLIP